MFGPPGPRSTLQRLTATSDTTLLIEKRNNHRTCGLDPASFILDEPFQGTSRGLVKAWSTPPPEGPEEERPGVPEAWSTPPPEGPEEERPPPQAWSTPPPPPPREEAWSNPHYLCSSLDKFPPPLVLIPNLPNPAHGQAMLGSQLGIGSGVFPDALVPGSDPSSIAVTRPVHYVGHGLL